MKKFTGTLVLSVFALTLLTISSCKKSAVQNMPFDCTDWSYITTNTTIPAGIYTVSCNVEVAQGATLTISPGTQLYFTQAGSLTVDLGASITAAGTASSPIIIRGSQQVAGYWQGVLINSVSLQNIFSYCTIADGGSSTGNNFNADVSIIGGTASFNNCTISNSSGAGLYVIGSSSNSAYFNSFTNNTLTGNNYPIVTRVLAASKIGSGNTFSGNTNNYIGILSSTVNSIDTLRPWAVPYLFMQTGSDGGVTVTGALTIAPGTNIVMGSNISLLASGTGTINAVGTAASPITFSGLQPTPGYWASVLIQTQSTLNNFQYCNFSYGGGSGGSYGLDVNEVNKGMLSTYMYLPATRSINVTNCNFSNSASSGIYVSATDGPPTVPPTYNSNIVTANTFTGCSPNVQQ